MREQILEILESQPYLSSREIGKLLGKHRQTITYHLNKMGINRDRNTIRRMNNTQRSFPIKISENAHQIILGSILGDGSISKNSRVEDSKLNLNSNLVIKHTLKQLDYIRYKEKLLNSENIKTHFNIIEAGKYKSSKIEGRIIKDNVSCVLKTLRNIEFNKYRDSFYKDIKIIPPTVRDLKPLGLAIWFMDDGAKHTSSYYLHTQGFTKNCQLILIKMLKDNFNVDAVLHKHRDSYNIYINTKSRDVFTDAIKPYICESMKYKLHMGRLKSRELLER